MAEKKGRTLVLSLPWFEENKEKKWISEFEPSLVYITNSRIARARGRILVSTKQNKTKQNKTKQNKTKL